VRADQQEEILKNTISAQEKERKRIAQDLHDEVGAMLSVVKLNIGRIEKKSDETMAKELAAETKTYLDEVITQVRRITRSLLPPSLEKLGLYFALEELANWINKSERMKIECWKSGEQFRFDNKKELAVFRIVQELLNNAIKHSDASVININARFSPNNNLMISVTDNGRGFELKEKMNTGLGLKNLESRIQIMNAKFKIKSTQEKGTTAIIYVNAKE
jgi:signal transduction histidine kinase